MLLNKFESSPKNTRRLAMTLISAGLVLVMVGASAWTHFGLRAFLIGPGGNEFLPGFLAGAGIGLELFGLVLMSRAARRSRADRI